MEKVRDVVWRGGLAAGEVNIVIGVGGSSRLPCIRDMLRAEFPRASHDALLDKDLLVSQGAALQAAIILGTIHNFVLVDVTSHDLGFLA